MLFRSLADAAGFFGQSGVALGTYQGVADVALQFTLASSGQQGFAFEYALVSTLASPVTALPVPEPATWALWALGAAALGWRGRHRNGPAARA